MKIIYQASGTDFAYWGFSDIVASPDTGAPGVIGPPVLAVAWVMHREAEG
jgi:hypothetical protein